MTTHRRFGCLVLLLALSALPGAGAAERAVIVTPLDPAPAFEAAAQWARQALTQTYPALRVERAEAASGRRSLVLSVDPSLDAEAYAVTAGGGLWRVRGGGPRALVYGVTALLEGLGWQVHLSGDLAPVCAPAWEDVTLAVHDRPLAAPRILFNWHNFLSGCTGWDLPQWQHWIDQAAKLRYNTIMVHAYGNNPMTPFRFNGRDKPLGYLSTTQRGRDWGTEHVNDVRRLVGGERFEGPVFGAGAARVPESERSAAAVRLMQQVFRHAASRGLEVCFALDMDTWMANPQDLIATLPAAARLRVGEREVANPDHPAGYAYWRARIATLLGNYPEITHLAFWTRRPSQRPGQGSIWLTLTPEQMPAAWRVDYDRVLAAHPEIARDTRSAGVCAMAHVAAAVARIADTLKPGLQLSYGSWGLDYTLLADAFFPERYGLIPLDYATVLNDPQWVAQLRPVGQHRRLIPVVWAHHDDHRYNGRPYVPFPRFQSLLASLGAEGFGIIHWKTHPLDLHMTNLGRQVWQATRDEPYDATVTRYGRGLCVAADPAWQSFLLDWHRHSPMFGRETTDRFLRLDRPYDLDGYASAAAVVAAARARRALLDRVDPAHLTEAGRHELTYHRAYEDFLVAFFTAHDRGHRAWQALQAGDRDAARALAREADPAAAVRRYADLIGARGPTRGELGTLVSLNLRWLPDYLDLKQRLGTAPRRLRFAPTQHDPLAQGAGHYSYWIDAAGSWWQVLGDRELGAGVTSAGLSLDAPRSLKFLTCRGGPLAPGDYRLRLIPSRAGGSVQVEITESGGPAQVTTLDLGPATRTDPVTWDLHLTGRDTRLTLRSASGAPSLRGLELLPSAPDQNPSPAGP